MKKILYLLFMGLLTLSACDEKDEPKPDESAIETFIVNGVSFNMVKVKGGSFTMNMELPVTPTFVLYQDSTLDATIAAYSIGQTEVTQALWQAVMGSNPSYFSTSGITIERDREFGDDLNRPVEYVSWDDCNVFIEKLNELTGRHFRIPTEAEWEFAARGGNKTHGYTCVSGAMIKSRSEWPMEQVINTASFAEAHIITNTSCGTVTVQRKL